MVGSLGKLKDSVESLSETYLQPGVIKDNIFNPKAPYNGNKFLLSKAPLFDQSAAPKLNCRCSSAADFGSVFGGSFQSCQTKATTPFPGDPFSKEKVTGGYVKEVVTYMVMDDLVVKPMSTISSITIINHFGIKYVSQLEEKIVSFGKDEALKLLKASLTNENVLTTVFLQK